MPRSKAAPAKKPTKSKETNKVKKPTKSKEKNKNEVKEEPDRVGPDTNIFNEYEENEFLNDQPYANKNSGINYHIFDPAKYRNQIHEKIRIVSNNNRKTSETMSLYEYTEIISCRAKQIEDGSDVFTDVGSEQNIIKMAEIELKMRKCPLSIRRMLSSNIAEIWAANEMIIPY